MQKIILVFSLISLIACQGYVKRGLTPEQQAEFIKQGKRITLLSGKALSSEVVKAIEEGGLTHAVDYCHLKASPLTDSLSKANKVVIDRVSDQYRNPLHKADALDLQVLDTYRQQIASGQELQPHLEMTGDIVIFYSPILLLNPLCLQCHGEPGSTMDAQVNEFIKTKYPDDLATGYKLGDLRGLWKITFSTEDKD